MARCREPIYLYGVALIGALIILFYVAQVLYRFFLMLLGDTEGAFFSTQTANEIAQSLIAAVFWGSTCWRCEPI